jgi:hypothetical protein
MSSKFGPIFQIGYVTRDLDAAIDHWRTLGVGPFFLFPMPLTFSYLEIFGTAVENPDFIARTALAYSGDTQIEIIVPGRTRSTFHEFLDSRRQGVHHVAVDTPDFSGALALAAGQGRNPVVQGRLPGFRFAYLGTSADPDATYFEVLELGPEAREMFGKIKRASQGWSGEDPVRHFR